MNNEELNVVNEIESEEDEEVIDEVWVCESCGAEFDNEDTLTRTSDGNLVCQDCLDEYYVWCDDCEQYVPRDESTYIEDCDRCVCDDCLHNGDYIYCDNCNEWHSADDSVEINDGSGYYSTICRHCFECGDYYYCDECGDYFDYDNIRYDEASDRYYCESCYDEIVGNREEDLLQVGSYHAHKHLYNTILELEGGAVDEDDEYTYGTETEMAQSDYTYDNEQELMETINGSPLKLVGERDSSIGDCGVEGITLPYRYSYLMAHVDEIKDMWNKAIELGYRGDNDKCGIHIHVSRPSDEVIDRIWLIMETFKNEIVKVARRHSERWAKFISDSTYTSQDMLKSIYYIKKNKSSSDRYYALNLTNEKTIEFRIFRGTLNYRTWLAYQQLVHNIMVQCGNLEKPVEDITWEDLTQGEYIEELCRKRDIVCYTRVVDNTKRIEDLINKRNEICDKVNKELKKYARQLLSGIKVDKSKFDNMDELYRRFANYRCGRMCSVENLLNNMREIEKMRDSEISIDDYILRVKDFISSNRYADLDIQMSDTMKEDILSLIRIDNGNNEEFGGEQ